MGITYLEVGVGNPANPDVTEQVELTVDSGAVHSVIPGPILQKLGIKPLDTQTSRLADGSKIVRPKSVALFKYNGWLGGADVTFGEDGDSKLLGATTLESLGLALDSIRRELRELPMVL